MDKEAKTKEMTAKAYLVEDKSSKFQGNHSKQSQGQRHHNFNKKRSNNNRYQNNIGQSHSPQVNSNNLYQRDHVMSVFGHFAAQCWYKKGGNDKQRRKRYNNKQAPHNVYLADCGNDMVIVVITKVNMVENIKGWVLDSGISKHKWANRSDFNSYITSDGGEEVFMGDSRPASVKVKGQ